MTVKIPPYYVSTIPKKMMKIEKTHYKSNLHIEVDLPIPISWPKTKSILSKNDYVLLRLLHGTAFLLSLHRQCYGRSVDMMSDELM